MYLALDRAGPAALWAKYLVGFVAVVGLVSGGAGDPHGPDTDLLRRGTRRALAGGLRARAPENAHAPYRHHRDGYRVLCRGGHFAAASARGHHLDGHPAGLRHCLWRGAGAAPDPSGPAPALQG